MTQVDDVVHDGSTAVALDVETFIDRFGVLRPSTSRFVASRGVTAQDLDELRFWFHPGTAELTEIKVQVGVGLKSDRIVSGTDLGIDLDRAWQEVRVPLAGRALLSEVRLSTKGGGRFYVDGMELRGSEFLSGLPRLARADVVRGERRAGAHVAVWDGRGDDGRALPSGPYFYRLHVGGREQTRKLLLLR